jgi:hypothetical protein
LVGRSSKPQERLDGGLLNQASTRDRLSTSRNLPSTSRQSDRRVSPCLCGGLAGDYCARGAERGQDKDESGYRIHIGLRTVFDLLMVAGSLPQQNRYREFNRWERRTLRAVVSRSGRCDNLWDSADRRVRNDDS